MTLFDEAQAIRGLEIDSIRVMGLFAREHTDEQGRMKKNVRAAIKEAWDGADPLHYARAANMWPDWFNGSVDVSKWEMLSAIKIAGVADKFQRLELVKEWRDKTLSYDDVRAKVDAIKKPKRERKPRKCPHCGEEL